MIRYLIILIALISSCSPVENCDYPSEFERQYFIKKGVKSFKVFRLKEGKRILENYHQINEDGLSTMLKVYQNGKLNYTIRSFYDTLNRLTQEDVKYPGEDWKLLSKNICNDSLLTETQMYYPKDKPSSYTHYINNPDGLNQMNYFYEDSTLQNIHQFYWNGDCKLDSIVRFDSDSNRTGQKKVFTYDRGLLKTESSYENDTLVKIDRYTYNYDHLDSKNVFEKIGDYRETYYFEYKDKLIINCTYIYEDLKDKYSDTTYYLNTYEYYTK